MEDIGMVLKVVGLGFVGVATVAALVVLIPLALGVWAVSHYDDTEVYLHG